MSILPPRPASRHASFRRLAAEGYSSPADAVAAVREEERRSRERKDCDILRSLATLLGERPEVLQRALLSSLAEGMADIALAAPRDDEDRNAVQEAGDVLRDLLANGPRPAKEVEKEARAAGISEKTLHRAKNMLGIKSQKSGYGGKDVWKWFLPAQCPKTVEDGQP